MIAGATAIDPAANTTQGPRLTVGVDTVRIAEVTESLSRFGQKYLDAVFTPHEQASCPGSAELRARGLAARFAAKEATFKALRSADLAGPWTAIEVRRDPGGFTDILLHGRAAEQARRSGIRDMSVSMTHDDELATAIVVAVGDTVSAGPTDFGVNSGATAPGEIVAGGERQCPNR